jgi:hypothetical protein
LGTALAAASDSVREKHTVVAPASDTTPMLDAQPEVASLGPTS